MNEKGYKARALLGGWAAWVAANGETEPVTEATGMPTQNTNATPPPQEQHVIASPNPTIDDSKTTVTVEPGKVSGTKVRPTNSTTAAPLKKKPTRHKRRHTRTHD